MMDAFYKQRRAARYKYCALGGRALTYQERAWLADVARGLAAIKPPGIPILDDTDLSQAAIDQLQLEALTQRILK